jgi:hypothetical protein
MDVDPKGAAAAAAAEAGETALAAFAATAATGTSTIVINAETTRQIALAAAATTAATAGTVNAGLTVDALPWLKKPRSMRCSPVATIRAIRAIAARSTWLTIHRTVILTS